METIANPTLLDKVLANAIPDKNVTAVLASPSTASVRDAICETLHRYCVEVDRGAIDGVSLLFTDDATYEFGDRTYRGRDGIASLFMESGKRAARVGVRGPVLHCMTTLSVAVSDDDGAATATSYVTVMTAGGVDHWGRYEDELRRQNGGDWLISRRRFRLAGAVPDGLGEALR